MTEQLIMEENGKRYRMLQVGETIEVGDEVRAAGSWIICGSSIGQVVRNEWEGIYPQGYYRRPIAENAK